MDGEAPARVLLVDDHPGMATAVRVMLRADGRFELAGVAGTLSEALAAGEDHDAVILDLNLPDAAGAEVVRRFARAHPGVPLVVHTAAGPDEPLGAAEALVRARVRKGSVDDLLAALAMVTGR